MSFSIFLQRNRTSGQLFHVDDAWMTQLKFKKNAGLPRWRSCDTSTPKKTALMPCPLVDWASKRLPAGNWFTDSAFDQTGILSNRCPEMCCRPRDGQLLHLIDMEGVHFNIDGLTCCVGWQRQAWESRAFVWSCVFRYLTLYVCQEGTANTVVEELPSLQVGLSQSSRLHWEACGLWQGQNDDQREKYRTYAQPKRYIYGKGFLFDFFVVLLRPGNTSILEAIAIEHSVSLGWTCDITATSGEAWLLGPEAG